MRVCDGVCVWHIPPGTAAHPDTPPVNPPAHSDPLEDHSLQTSDLDVPQDCDQQSEREIREIREIRERSEIRERERERERDKRERGTTTMNTKSVIMACEHLVDVCFPHLH